MKKNRSVQLFLLMMLICFPQLSETIYTPSLPDVAQDYGIGSHLAQWTLSIYFIGFALGVGFWGFYSDSRGRKKAIEKGISIYVIGCVGCFLSPSIYALLGFRLVQAFGISIGSVIVQSILRESFKGKELHRIFSMINVFMAISPALGPFVGGYLAEWFGWRSNFIALIAFILTLAIFIHLFLEETNKNLGRKFDSSRLRVLALKMGKTRRPIYFALLVALFNGIMFSYYSHAPFIFVDLLNLSSSQYGKLGFFPGLGVVLGSWISRRCGSCFEEREVLMLGCLGALGAMLLLNANIFIFLPYALNIYSKLSLLLGPITLFFIFFSIAISQLLSGGVKDFMDEVGAASSFFGFTYYVFTSLFNFLMGYFDNGTIKVMPIYFLFLSLLIVGLFFLFFKKEQATAKKIQSFTTLSKGYKSYEHK